MKITAREFNHRPGQAFRAADKGERVIITNTHYPGVVFELRVTQKEELWIIDQKPINPDTR